MATRYLNPADFSEQARQRFWSRVAIADEGSCWLWRRFRTPDGYGMFCNRSQDWGSHRVAFALQNNVGLSSEEMVCHHCDNPPCCNPAHLFKGTNQENQQDASRKGRLSEGDRHWTHAHPEKLKRGDDHPNRQRPERVVRGSKHPAAKFTEADILTIRAAYAVGDVTITALARQYNVHLETMQAIIRRRNWKHI